MILSATGHRPNKLGGYDSKTYTKLLDLAYDYLKDDKPDSIISGMALGWDTAWAEAGQMLNIPVTAAVPFFGQESMWPKTSQDNYKRILSNCSDVLYICDKGYAPWKMQIRNEYMVDHSDLVVALWDGSSGGTGNCVEYAEKQNKTIVNLWNKYNKGT